MGRKYIAFRKNKKWKIFFTEEELKTIIEFCKRKIIEIKETEKKYPLKLTEKERQKLIKSKKTLDLKFDDKEYKIMIKDIEDNVHIKSYNFVELYCAMTNYKRPLTKAERSIKNKCHEVMIKGDPIK